MLKTRNLVILLVVLFILSFFLQSNYFVIKPGKVENLNDIIGVENVGDQKEEGAFYLVTVAQQPANIFLFLNSFIDPSMDLIPRWRVFPPHMDPEEYNEIMRQWMIDSQHLSKVIALERSGFHIPIKSDGIMVVDLMEDSPALNILEPGDIIKKIDGEEVFMAEELVQKVQGKPIGSKVSLTFEREGETFTEDFFTGSHAEDEERSVLGIYVRSLDWEPELPVDITIETGDIAGPSAGFMFVLEIMNQLSEEDLSGGKKISGTGTINMEKEIGSIGGVKQKIKAAERIGVDIFFVPQDNMEEARRAARNIKLVKVRSLDDVLHYLNYQLDSSINRQIEGSFSPFKLWEVSVSQSASHS
ncbi:MAG: PDZ domain-containing protein [Candidatus Syntrophonatronum acetioxidans]|uniref:PDZ domain-containing protein n=1 Tax=Candidatus Syntrophonatronum acetioxidans TaxID=1795816 RepID=A0A424YHW8_9FIRM|nr:MAG: PDZ domain-containing protein [Candidatus Syntrophonatronum acetioxidans]